MSSSGEERSSGVLAAAISNMVVKTLSEYTGRGPTKARTNMHENLVTVLLQETLTRGEQTLVRAGQTALVLDTRKQYQNAMRLALVSGVEELTGRRVVAFMSDNHVSPDWALEAFVLASENGHPTFEHQGGDR